MTKFQENETTELKKSTSELKEAVISIVAMLNKHQRGEIWFGIKNDGSVAGQQVSDKTIRDVSKSIADHVEPRIYPVVEQVTIGGKACIKVQAEGGEHLIMPMAGHISALAMRIANSMPKNLKGYELTKPDSVGKTTQKTSVKTSVKILEAIAENNRITIPELAGLAGVTKRSVERNIQQLQLANRLRRVGPDKGGYWEAVCNHTTRTINPRNVGKEWKYLLIAHSEVHPSMSCEFQL